MQNATLPPALALWRAGQSGRAFVPSGGVANEPAETEGSTVSRAGVGAPALLLACGNSLRQDDGVGLQIAEAAEQLFPASRLRIIAAPQFTPEMAADVARTDLVLFVDASAVYEPGAIRVLPVAAYAETAETHRLDPPGLMNLAQQLCGHAPARAFVLTIGAHAFGYGEDLSGRVRQAVPRAVRLLGNLITALGNAAR